MGGAGGADIPYANRNDAITKQPTSQLYNPDTILPLTPDLSRVRVDKIYLARIGSRVKIKAITTFQDILFCITYLFRAKNPTSKHSSGWQA